MFITLNEMGTCTGTSMVEGEISKSDSMTSTVVGAPAACSAAAAPGVPPPPSQAAATSARTPSVAMIRPRTDPCMADAASDGEVSVGVSAGRDPVTPAEGPGIGRPYDWEHTVSMLSGGRL